MVTGKFKENNTETSCTKDSLSVYQ